ncbi:LrgB family protein [Methylobacterium sp. NEAU 140]|uniref:LrgB family protein n=1 Tax=Methylobacterium sp. NEAU 140 TaxID=3064945 RepID=UPI002735DDC6|nr:LrgB family protein [Methylobacterium sp. NEAU 140]MDP4027106.1 LrgB family protein [Methylobacterium sp. NEAU 140]
MPDAHAWARLPEQPALEVGVTVLAFLCAVRLARWSGNNPFLNPTLVAIVIVVALINATGVSYATYLRGAGFIQFLLAPTVVLLAVPLYRQTSLIRASGGLIAAALLVGMPTGVLSAVGIAWALGASQSTLLSIAPKGVTTGIAIGISEAIGGVPALTAVLVISTGIVGAIAGPAIQRWLHVEDDRVTGLAIGIAGHGVGTARALQISEVAGAFAGLGMSLNGVLTGVLLPLAMRVF